MLEQSPYTKNAPMMNVFGLMMLLHLFERTKQLNQRANNETNHVFDNDFDKY